MELDMWAPYGDCTLRDVRAVFEGWHRDGLAAPGERFVQWEQLTLQERLEWIALYHNTWPQVMQKPVPAYGHAYLSMKGR
jgi:hypothetical protein